MRAFISMKYHEDLRNRALISRIAAALEQRGIETMCIVRDVEQWGAISYSEQDLMQRTFQEIDRSDLIVVDVTEKGVGIGIEAGYAYAKKKSIITLVQSGFEISGTLKGISREIITYEQIDELDRLFAQIHFLLMP